MIINKIYSNYHLLSNYQKKGQGTPAYTRYINRWLGRVLASILGYFKIKPNSITLISSLITLSAYSLFLLINKISFSFSFFLVLLLLFGYALDSADGQVSRLLKMNSAKGEWFDHVFDAIKIPFGHGVAIFLIISRIDLNLFWWGYYLVVLSLASAGFLSGILKAKLLAFNNKNKTLNKNNSQFVRSFLTLPLDYGILMMLFFFVPFQNTFFILYSGWSVIFVLYSILLFAKSAKELNF